MSREDETYSRHATRRHHGRIHLAHGRSIGAAGRGSHGSRAAVELGLELRLRWEHSRQGWPSASLRWSRHGWGQTRGIILLLQLCLANVPQLRQGNIDGLAVQHPPIHLSHSTSGLDTNTFISWPYLTALPEGSAFQAETYSLGSIQWSTVIDTYIECTILDLHSRET